MRRHPSSGLKCTKAAKTRKTGAMTMRQLKTVSYPGKGQSRIQTRREACDDVGREPAWRGGWARSRPEYVFSNGLRILVERRGTGNGRTDTRRNARKFCNVCFGCASIRKGSSPKKRARTRKVLFSTMQSALTMCVSTTAAGWWFQPRRITMAPRRAFMVPPQKRSVLRGFFAISI